MDNTWWKVYARKIAGSFELWTTSFDASRIFKLNRIIGEGGGGLSRRPGVIRLGGNSGFQALGLALHFGAAKVVLLGYDMQAPKGRLHWHADHTGVPAHRLGNPVPEKMREWVKHFTELSNQSRVPIVNATRQSALKCFPKVSLEESLA